MLVGEQPGDQEDRQGRPFVGPAGRMLAKSSSRHESAADLCDERCQALQKCAARKAADPSEAHDRRDRQLQMVARSRAEARVPQDCNRLGRECWSSYARASSEDRESSRPAHRIWRRAMACGDDPPFIVAEDPGGWSQGQGPGTVYRGFEHRQETCLGTGFARIRPLERMASPGSARNARYLASQLVVYEAR